MQPITLLSLGDIAWDILFKPETDIVPGSDVYGAVQLFPGGSAANVAVWARRAGARVRLAGKVGDDALGELMMRRLRAEGVADHVIVSPGGATTRIGVLVSPHGERAFITDRDSLIRFEPGDLQASLLDGADVLFFTGYGVFTSGTTAFLEHLLAEARRRNIPIAFDPSSSELITEYGAKRLLREIAPLDCLLTNEQEAAAMASGQPPVSLLDVATLVVLKRGPHGAVALGNGGATSAPAPPVTVVDTTGSGDAFDAAFLVHYARQRNIAQALAEGNRLGAYVAGCLGAQPPAE